VEYRFLGVFASGVATGVYGRRSFRDFSRRDITRELPGWPDGPQFEVRSEQEQKSLKKKHGLLAGVGFIVELATDILGGANMSTGPAIPDPPQEPENEVDDFPVMWADPGTWARTVPWQLDPARRPKDHHVQIILTDRRLVFLGGPKGAEGTEFLHTIPRECVVKGEQMIYSPSKGDLRVTFFDGSWIRLATYSGGTAHRIADHLNGHVTTLRETDISPAQRAGADRYLSGFSKRTYPPIFSVAPDDHLRMDVPHLDKSGNLVSPYIYFDPRGKLGFPPSLETK
jgi:hypothetical protein